MKNMKTMKRFLALLLFFVAAMNVQNLSAQTNGDVNNDGTVNEADITAIIEIMKEANEVGTEKYYWYVGQEAVTADNYTTLNGVTQVTSYPTKYEYTPSSRAYTYVLVANNKTVTKIEDGNLGSSISFTLDDTIKITGYSVYKSLVKISGKVYIHIS